MAIKMRKNVNVDAVCDECHSTVKQSLDMYDICLCGQTFTICDACNEKLLNKTLKANCLTNGRVKSNKDLAITQQRRIKARR